MRGERRKICGSEGRKVTGEGGSVDSELDKWRAEVTDIILARVLIVVSLIGLIVALALPYYLKFFAEKGM